MGKKTKRTRWRTLPIDVGASSNGHDNNSHHHPHHHHLREDTSKIQAPSPETTTTKVYFNEDEYTKITTPRQDVLFKKGYFARRRSQLAAAGINIISDPSSVYETPHGDYAEDDYINEDYDMQGYYGTPQTYVDPAGVYYNYGNSSYEVYDPYTGTTTVLMGPPPGTQYPPGGNQQVMPPLEWYNPAAMPPQHAPPYYSKQFPGDSSQAYPSPESLCPPTSPQDLCDDPSIYPHSFIYPGYMLSTTNTYSNGGVGVPNMTAGSLAQTSSCDSSSFKKRKRRKKRKRGEGVTEEEYESSSEDQCSQSGASEQLDSKTTSDSGVHTHNSGESTPVTPPLSISFHPHPVPAFTSTDEDSTSSMPCFTNSHLPVNSCSYLPVNPYHMSYTDMTPPQPVMEHHYVMQQHKSKKLKYKRTKADHLNKFFPSAALASFPCSFHSPVPNQKPVEPAPKQLTILKPETPRKQPCQITILKPNCTHNETSNTQQRDPTAPKHPVRDLTLPKNPVDEGKVASPPPKHPVDEEKVDLTPPKPLVVKNKVDSISPKHPVVEDKVPLAKVEITTNNTNCSTLKTQDKYGEAKAEDNEVSIDKTNISTRGEEAPLSSNSIQQIKPRELNKSHQGNTNQLKMSTDFAAIATELNNGDEKTVNKKYIKEKTKDVNDFKNVQLKQDLEKEDLGELNQRHLNSIVLNGVLDEVTNMKAEIKEFTKNNLPLTNGNLHNSKDKSLSRSPSPQVSKITNGFHQPDKGKLSENGSDNKTNQKQKQKSKKNKSQTQIDGKFNGMDKNITLSGAVKIIQNRDLSPRDVEYKSEENNNKSETAKINGFNKLTIQDNGPLTNGVKEKKKSIEKVATLSKGQEIDILTGFPSEITDDNKFETCSDKSEELEELYIKNNPLLANLVHIEKINNNERDVKDKNKSEILKKELLETSGNNVENEIINKITSKIETIIETKNQNTLDKPEQIKTETSDQTKRLTDVKDDTNPNSIETTKITASKKKADKKKKTKEDKNQSQIDTKNKTGHTKIKEKSPDPVINASKISETEGIVPNGDTRSEKTIQDLTIDKTDQITYIKYISISNINSTKKPTTGKDNKTTIQERKSTSPDKIVKRKNSKKKKSPPPQLMLPSKTDAKEPTIDKAKNFIDEMLREAVNKVNEQLENNQFTSTDIPVNEQIVQKIGGETLNTKIEVKLVTNEIDNADVKPILGEILHAKNKINEEMSNELDQESGPRDVILTKALNAKNEINSAKNEVEHVTSQVEHVISEARTEKEVKNGLSEAKLVISEIKPVLSETKPVIRENPINEAVSTIKSEVKSFISEEKSVKTEVKPVTKEVKHVLNEVKSVTSEVKPVENEAKPVKSEVKPLLKEIKTFTSEVKPVTKEVKPVLNELKPVTSEVKSVTSEVKPVIKSKKMSRKNSGKSLKTNSKSKSNTPERRPSDIPTTAPAIHLTDVVTKWLEEEHGGKLPVDYLDDEEDEVFVQPTRESATTGSKNWKSNPSPALFVNAGDRVADKNSDIIDRCDAKASVSKYYNLGIRTSPEMELMTPASKDPQFTYPGSPIPCGICCMIQ
uniref:Uncharacterized protein n=1 Tax=Cacopsylla melanoneura TaxID=428564 RepID=A0A8D8QQC9_9HEMI